VKVNSSIRKIQIKKIINQIDMKSTTFSICNRVESGQSFYSPAGWVLMCFKTSCKKKLKLDPTVWLTCLLIEAQSRNIFISRWSFLIFNLFKPSSFIFIDIFHDKIGSAVFEFCANKFLLYESKKENSKKLLTWNTIKSFFKIIIKIQW
jgi:hypothetical protein